MRPRLLAAVALAIAVASEAPVATVAEEPGELRLEAAIVEPASAAPDTLCKLEAQIRNGGKAVASSFAFGLKLDGKEIGAYRDRLFLDPIPPGEARTIPLLHFWTNETGRPLPAGGAIAVELTLQEAHWMKEEKDAEGTRVWTDLGIVPGLPQTARASVTIKK